MGQADVGHSVGRIGDPSGDQSPANQSLIPHEEQVFKNLSFFGEMFQIRIMHWEDALVQTRIYFL